MLTYPLSSPFSETASKSGIDGALFPVSLDGIGYLVDTGGSDYSIRMTEKSVEVLRTLTNTQQNESALLPPEVWRRVANSWHHGGGQKAYDRDTSDPSQFLSSMGVDVWEPYQVSLLPDTDAQHVLEGQGAVEMVVVGDVLATVAGSLLHWQYDLDGPGSTVTTFTSGIRSITSDGVYAITAHSDGTVRATHPTYTGVMFTLPGVDFVRFVKNRLIVGAGGVLYDPNYDASNGTPTASINLAADPVPELVFIAPQNGFRWVDAVEGLNALYLLGGVGDKWSVHSLTIKSDGTGLDTPIVAAQLPDGEIGHALGSYLGYVIVGTSLGLRFAAPDAQAALTLGRLIETPQPVLCFEGQSRFVWYGLTSPAVGKTGLGRLSLADFTDPLTPAYAPDLMAPTSGVVRSVVTFQGRRVFAVDNVGTFSEAVSRRAPSGYLEQGRVAFNVPDEKIPLYTAIQHEPLRGGLYVDHSYDTAGYVQIGRSVPGSTRPPNMNIDDSTYTTLGTRIRFERDSADPTVGPVLTHWETRALANAGDATEFTVPLVLADTYEMGGSEINRDVVRDKAHIRDLFITGRVFIYREGLETWRANVVGYTFIKRSASTQRTGWQGILLVTIRSIQ